MTSVAAKSLRTCLANASGVLALFFCLTTSALPSEIDSLQVQLYHRSYNRYLADLRATHPELNLGTTLYPAPNFDSQLSRNDWLPLFVSWTYSLRQQEIRAKSPSQASTDFPADSQTLTKVSSDEFLSYYQNVPFAHFSSLETFKPIVSSSGAEVENSVKIELPQAWPGEHTLNLDSYVDQRFPHELQDFVRNQNASLILDDSNCADAYSAQSRLGYTKAFRFMGAADSVDSQFLVLGNNAKPALYQVVVCDIRGVDDRNRIVEMIGPAFRSHAATLVHHRRPAPLFALNAEGQSLQINPVTDLVVIGFQNSVWWQISAEGKASNWKRHLLTSSGVELDIFIDEISSRRIVSVENIYGDEMIQALTFLWDRGARRFIYLGTAGGLDGRFHLGDVLLPTRFRTDNGDWFSFANSAVAKSLVLEDLPQIYSGTRHGYVSTLIDETRPRISYLANSGVQSIDVEARYFAEFLKDRDAEKALVLTVSDLPLDKTGNFTFDQHSHTRELPILSAKAVIAQLLKQEH